MSIKNLSIVLLGPKNSFSDKARKELGFDNSSVIYSHSIPGIFEELKKNSNFLGLVPLENLLNGQVSATYDSLLKSCGVKLDLDTNSSSLKTFEIIHTINLTIDLKIGRIGDSTYSLVEAEEIYSHEQALGQSEEFILKNCPNAKLIPVESTSAAVISAKTSKKKAFAISSLEALTESGFVDIKDTIEPEKLNKTRFAVVANKSLKEEILKTIKLLGTEQKVTSICLNPKMDRQGILLEILSIVSENHSCNLLSIHSRPDLLGGFVFYLEIEGGIEDLKVQNCLKELEVYCKESTGNAASIDVLGSYLRTPFSPQIIQSVGIVGAKGDMGQWFVWFFKTIGLNVFEIDLDSTIEEKRQISSCDVLIFSVPFQGIEKVYSEYKEFIKEGTLIVDNSSLKKVACESLDKVYSDKFEIVSIHTMFGPKEKILNGQNIIFTTTNKSRSKTKELEKIFYKHGAIITHASVDEHDKAVAITQSLVHFISLGFEKVLNEKGMNKELLNAFLTPNSERLFQNLERTIGQSEDLTKGIVYLNQYSKEIRDLFIESLRTLNTSRES